MSPNYKVLFGSNPSVLQMLNLSGSVAPDLDEYCVTLKRTLCDLRELVYS